MAAEDPVAWFLDRGWTVAFTEEEGAVWAHLASADNPDFVVQRYGRGTNEVEAALRAKERWEVEQIGGQRQGDRS